MAQDPLIGKTLANFRIDSRLGQGGMAVVYLGMDIQLERPVAIKLINAQFQGNPEYAERFVAEAKLVARWRHENIISVYYANQQDELYYFVMEHIDGATLEDLMHRYLQDGDLIPHLDVIRIGRAVASGLDYAHKQGVVHRDVKPANVMIDRDDRVVVMDFGLALDMGQGSMGQIFGTPHYVAPEQVRHSADASPQSDIYSLGIVMYEIVTGALPFDDPSATALAVQHLTEPPPPPRMINPAINHASEDVLLKALSKEPEDRYETATAFIDALETALFLPADESETVPAIVLPAAITKRTHEFPRISHMSISEMLEIELAEKEPPVPSPAPVTAVHSHETQKTAARDATRVTKSNRPKSEKKLKTVARPQTVDTPVKQKSKMPMFAGIGIVGLVLIIALVGFIMSSSGNDSLDGEVQLPATETVETIAEVSTDEPVIQATIESATATDMPVNIPTSAPTDDIAATAAIINVTNDAIATSNAQILLATSDANVLATNNANALATSNANVLATSNAQLEATLTQQAIQANTIPLSPTELYPSGRLLELTYNSAGFYLRNSSDSRVRDSRLAFQAIDVNGNGVNQSFNGVDWTRFYNSVDTGRCVVIELSERDLTRPTNCISSQYNSLLTFTETDGRIFWTGSNGAVQFIVYWDGNEIARCAIANGYCQVRVGE